MRKMILAFVLLAACNAHPSVENRVQNFMKEKYVPNLDDPSSYQFINMSIDTVTGKDDLSDLQRMANDTILFSSDKRAEFISQANELQSNQHYLDSVFKYFVRVDFRAKNKLGALVKGHVSMFYHPQKDSIQLVKY